MLRYFLIINSFCEKIKHINWVYTFEIFPITYYTVCYENVILNLILILTIPQIFSSEIYGKIMNEMRTKFSPLSNEKYESQEQKRPYFCLFSRHFCSFRFDMTFLRTDANLTNAMKEMKRIAQNWLLILLNFLICYQYGRFNIYIYPGITGTNNYNNKSQWSWLLIISIIWNETLLQSCA